MIVQKKAYIQWDQGAYARCMVFVVVEYYVRETIAPTLRVTIGAKVSLIGGKKLVIFPVLRITLNTRIYYSIQGRWTWGQKATPFSPAASSFRIEGVPCSCFKKGRNIILSRRSGSRTSAGTFSLTFLNFVWMYKADEWIVFTAG